MTSSRSDPHRRLNEPTARGLLRLGMFPPDPAALVACLRVIEDHGLDGQTLYQQVWRPPAPMLAGLTKRAPWIDARQVR